MRYALQYKGGSYELSVEAMGGMANAFFLMSFRGMPTSHKTASNIPQSLPLMAIPIPFQESEVLLLNGRFIWVFGVLPESMAAIVQW